MSRYTKALKTRNKITTIPVGMDRQRVLEGIASITEQLWLGMPAVERIMLVHDREDLRDILALMDGN